MTFSPTLALTRPLRTLLRRIFHQRATRGPHMGKAVVAPKYEGQPWPRQLGEVGWSCRISTFGDRRSGWTVFTSRTVMSSASASCKDTTCTTIRGMSSDTRMAEAVLAKGRWQSCAMVEIAPRTPAMKSVFLTVSETFDYTAGQHASVRLMGANGYTAVLSSSIDRVVRHRESTSSQHSRRGIRVCFQ
ncbi:hypothetical protein ABIA94_005411 [Bradyrhizobium sp. LA7.1]